MSSEFDDAVVEVFLKQQTKLFPEKVAESAEEAREYLSASMAVVVDSKEEVLDYLDGLGMDITELGEDEIAAVEEVFEVGDGRYLIVDV